MAKNRWTPLRVEERLVEAADVMRRLPEIRVQGYYSLWPKMLAEFSDLVGQEPQRLKRPPPSPDAITRMEETLGWLRWLEAEDAKLAWARAEHTPWKMICWRFGIGRATAHRHWRYVLSLIAWRLNGRRPPVRRSRRFVVEQASSAGCHRIVSHTHRTWSDATGASPATDFDGRDSFNDS